MFSKHPGKWWAAPVLAAGVITLGALPCSAAAHPASTGAGQQSDFDGDGYADLVAGAPGGTISGQTKAGYVSVMYGGPGGLSAARHTTISRATSGVPGAALKDEGFGSQVSTGDLDGDGYADLVIGRNVESLSAQDGGSVIVWGGPTGLTGGTAVPGYGSVSQTGDFDGDGNADLVLFQSTYMGVDDPSGTQAVLWRGPVSRTGTPASSSAFEAGPMSSVDVMGATSGDVNGDGRTDLMLSEYIGESGFGNRLYLGSASGPQPTPWGTVPYGTYFVSMALGDLNGDGYDDVVAGGHGDYDNQFTVAYGSASGVTAEATWKNFDQDTPGVPGADEMEDYFGYSVSVGDVDGDGYADVVAGSPGEALDTTQAAGAVTLLHGGASGLTGDGAQVVTQNSTGVPGVPETEDAFGSTVRLLDTDGDGHADLAAAAPGENDNTGAVWALHGSATGIVPDGALVFGPGALATPATGARFGSTLR